MIGKTFGKSMSKGMNRVIHSLFYTNNGRIVVSIILGLGLATIFRKYCEGKNCYKFIGPKQNEIRDQIFALDSNKESCYVLNEKIVKCDTNKKIIDFA